jgi:HTH-type transcriptional regulator/antitoxin HipB
MDYPLRFADQLRAHLQALRKKRGLTQAQAGALVGVSQARIAEIEANPGAVGFEQLMKLLAALGASISLRDEDAAPANAELPDGDPRPSDRNATRAYGRVPSPAAPVVQEKGVEPPAAPSLPEPQAPRPAAAGPAPAARERFAATPRKGSW